MWKNSSPLLPKKIQSQTLNGIKLGDTQTMMRNTQFGERHLLRKKISLEMGDCNAQAIVSDEHVPQRKASVSKNTRLIGSLSCEGESLIKIPQMSKKPTIVPILDFPIRPLDIVNEYQKPGAVSERINDRQARNSILLVKASSPKVAAVTFKDQMVANHLAQKNLRILQPSGGLRIPFQNENQIKRLVVASHVAKSFVMSKAEAKPQRVKPSNQGNPFKPGKSQFDLNTRSLHMRSLDKPSIEQELREESPDYRATVGNDVLLTEEYQLDAVEANSMNLFRNSKGGSPIHRPRTLY